MMLEQALKTQIMNQVDRQFDDQTRVLADLVRIPSTRFREAPAQDMMVRLFREDKLSVDRWQIRIDDLKHLPGYSPHSQDYDDAWNVVGSWRPESPTGRSLILNGHIDVVPEGPHEMWARHPFDAVVKDGWMYGRGAGDMKAGLILNLYALRALRALGYQPAADVYQQSVVEEECTGNGTLQCLLAGARADACVITEPHHDHFTVAQVGVLWFHVDVRGVPGHAARGGRGAFEAALEVLAALRALEAELNADPPPPYDAIEHPINLNVGVVRAGDWPSTVTAECTLSCRLAMYPGDDPADLQRRVEAAVAPYEVRYDGFACEGSVVSHEEDVVVALGEAYAAVHGERPALRATTATTDARHFVRNGIPAICYGPLAERIHGIDERVSLRSMVEVARVLARFVLDWCGESNDGGVSHGRS
jgi:acetylornithine deacetylase